MNQLLNEIKKITSDFDFESLLPLIDSLEKLSQEKLIDIAILGQFKAGKSSFINSLLNKPILPTGVVPITSAITRIIYGEREKVIILFQDGHSERISLTDIADFITEEENPDNKKRISQATIEFPGPDFIKGLCITDTPGLGSIYLNNTKTTRDKLAHTSIAVICISAERPLSEADMELIRELKNTSFKLVCLLTKADLFTKNQINEIEMFLKRSLEKETGESLPVYKYSIYSNPDLYKEIFIENICRPLTKEHKGELTKIYNHRLQFIAERCINYLDMAYDVSMRSEEERDQLKARIFDEKVNSRFIRHEIKLIATDSKSMVRESIYALLAPYTDEIIIELQQKFRKEYPVWNGNLYKISRKYEQWLKKELTLNLSKIVQQEKTAMNELMGNIGSHFGYFTKSLKERIYENVRKVLGIELKADDHTPEFRPIKQPDISIYTAFDTPIDLLWFMFPMVLFRKIFGKYFLKQIPREVSKNIYRLTSNITGIINKETDDLGEKTYDFIRNELNSIDTALSCKNSSSETYHFLAKQLRKHIAERN